MSKTTEGWVCVVYVGEWVLASAGHVPEKGCLCNYGSSFRNSGGEKGVSSTKGDETAYTAQGWRGANVPLTRANVLLSAGWGDESLTYTIRLPLQITFNRLSDPLASPIGEIKSDYLAIRRLLAK